MCLCLLLKRLPIFRSMATLTSRLRLTRVLRVCHQSCRPVPCSQTLPVNTVLAKNSSLPHPLVGALSRFCHNLSGQEEQEIYSGILSTQIKLVKSFSLGTSMIGKCYFSFSPPPFLFLMVSKEWGTLQLPKCRFYSTLESLQQI